MTAVVVVQARCSSSRLPGKVLLPLGGIPLAVLVALRAGNTGRHVIVATSTECSDDPLAATLDTWKIPYFRGSLNNTLERVVQALAEYSDDTLVIRLTADNPFPDGHLLDALEEDFLQRQLQYLCCNGEESGVPYGVSAEITYLSHLRTASNACNDPYDLEHVTPWVIRNHGMNYYRGHYSEGMGILRATIDTYDDYQNLFPLFHEQNVPIKATSRDLIIGLSRSPNAPHLRHPAKRMVLGTVQLGLSYGIANLTGKPEQHTATEIVHKAIINGVVMLDTAHAYGSSEEVVGRALNGGWRSRCQIVTKLSPLNECAYDTETRVAAAFAEASMYQSLHHLKTGYLDVLMLHRAEHLTMWNGAVWKLLIRLRDEGVIGRLGVSVQSTQELSYSLNNPDVSVIQMPYNLLDWRWDEMIPEIVHAKRTRSLSIHARSSLLQGLLPSDDPELWRRANVQQPDEIIEWLQSQADLHQCKGVAELCIAYSNSCDWIDGVVVGVETPHQLEANLHLFAQRKLGENDLIAIRTSRPVLSDETLNPVNWK